MRGTCLTFDLSTFILSGLRHSARLTATIGLAPICRNRFGVLIAESTEPRSRPWAFGPRKRYRSGESRVSAPNLLRRWALGPTSRCTYGFWTAVPAVTASKMELSTGHLPCVLCHSACLTATIGLAPICRNRFGVLIAWIDRTDIASVGLRPTEAIS